MIIGKTTKKKAPCQAMLGEGDLRCTVPYAASHRSSEDPPFCVNHLRRYHAGKRIVGYDGKVYDLSGGQE